MNLNPFSTWWKRKQAIGAAKDAFYDKLSESLTQDAGGYLKGAKKAGRAAAQAVNEAEAKIVGQALEKEVRAATQGNILVRGVKRMGKTVKWGAIGAGALAAFAILTSSMRKGHEASSVAADRGDVDAQLNALAAQAPMDMGPADGRAPNEWAARVRGGAPAMAAQPKASVAEGAQDLGAARSV